MENSNISFKTGNLLLSYEVNNDFIAIQEFREFCNNCIQRHISCDWGDLDKEDIIYNDKALLNNQRLLSSYLIPNNIKTNSYKIFIITESDRAVTTILYPSEY